MKNILIGFLLLISCVSFSQNIGIGTQNPKNKLHVIDGANPVRFEGLQSFIPSDSAILITTSDSGVVRYITINELSVMLAGINTDEQTLFIKGDSVCITNGNCIPIDSLVKNFETLTDLGYVSGRYLVYQDENLDLDSVDMRSVVRAHETVTNMSFVPSSGWLYYAREGGTVISINLISLVKTHETVTTMVLNSDTCIIYTKENGTNDTICLPDLIRASQTPETITTMVLNSDTCIIYTKENGTNDTICLPDLIRGSETVTSIYARDSVLVYFDENNDSTVINIKAFIDSFGSDDQLLTYNRFFFSEDTIDIEDGNSIRVPAWWEQNTRLSLKPKYSNTTSIFGGTNYKSFMLGDSNSLDNRYGFIGVAKGVKIKEEYSFVGSGLDHVVNTGWSGVLGGNANSILSPNVLSHPIGNNLILWGSSQNIIAENLTIGLYNLMGNGQRGVISEANKSVVLNGDTNSIFEGSYNLIGTGFGNVVMEEIGAGVESSYSTVINGRINYSRASYQTLSGEDLLAVTPYETVFGRNNFTAFPNSTTSWHPSDYLFVLGNGIASSTASNAFVVLKNGNAFVNGTVAVTSDLRLKKNITPLTGSLNKLLTINGYSYYWKDTEIKDTAKQIGLLSQEVQKVFPELTLTQDSILTLNYQGLIPVVIEAMKEQQAQIEAQKKQVEAEKKKNQELEERLAELERLMKELLKSKENEDR